MPVYLHRKGDALQYLNPNAFSLPDVGKFGNLGRGTIRGPGISTVDLSVVKNWRLTDHHSLQLRVEMFNVFNHTNFQGVDAGLFFDNVAAHETFGKPRNPSFGQLTGTRGPREIQMGLKFNF